MMKMNGAIEADLLMNCTDMSVLERQRAHLKYLNPGFDSPLPGFYFSDSSMINGGETDGFLATAGLNLPMIYGETTVEGDPRLSISPDTTIGSGSFKKRKFDTETKGCNGKKKKMMNRDELVEEEEEEKSKITEQYNGSTKSIKKIKNKAKKEENNYSNDSSKVTKELQKTDYIHVRARRGQATDSHSIAERVRREKISERMKFLQDLVPGCDKITGKAGMLDEIINYVQSLQRQIEFLSMKLAVVNPRPDFDMDDIFAKEVASTPMTVVVPSPEMVNSGYSHEVVNSGYSNEIVSSGYPFNPMQQVDTSSDPLSCFNNAQAPLMWDSLGQNLYGSLGV